MATKTTKTTKKATAKKAPAKKATAKKAPAKKTTAKKAPAKKATAKKAPAKKATAKKPAAKTTTKKTTTKKAPAKKAEVGEEKPTLVKPPKYVTVKGPARPDGQVPILKADPDCKLTPAQLKGLYEKLVSERGRVIDGVKRHVGEAVEDQDRLPDDVDLANRHANQAYLLRFADKENKLLRQINLALSKLETGDYGVCEGTGEPIGYARLKIRPWTRYSVQHKEELERRRAHEKR
jgi:RNA polymerase-binding protein DksA